MPLCLAVTGCASVLPEPAVGDSIYHYVRSNRDGSETEHVVHFRPSRQEIAVYKWVEKCTTAAYVTAKMDNAVREGRLFVAGKVARDGSQASFGTLTVNPAASALLVDVTPPGGQRIQMQHSVRSRPFLLFDFDFADLNAFLQEHGPRSGFAYELPVIWPGDPRLFRDYGQLKADYAGDEEHLGRRTRRFDLTVAGPTPSTGRLWIDSERGFIVEAELGLPNHQEYRDFRLKLDRVETGGTAAWDALTKSQYADCSTGN